MPTASRDASDGSFPLLEKVLTEEEETHSVHFPAGK